MTSALLHAPRLRQRQADALAATLLLLLCALWIPFTWNRHYSLLSDNGWYMQVAARVVAGDVLFRDALWMYGPLPVYLLGGLFRWLGSDVATLSALNHMLGILSILLMYVLARFLLPTWLALLCTAAMTLGGWWGGFIAYSMAYTGAAAFGAVFGLMFLICLLAFLARGRVLWLAGAGVATAGATLSKPEFAVACTGTGLLMLAAVSLAPTSTLPPWQQRRARVCPLLVYLLAMVLVVGAAYALIAASAGWSNVLAGITGYNQDTILLHVWPPWGNRLSWGYIVRGLGGWSLMAAGLLAVAARPLRGKAAAGILGLAAAGAVLLSIPYARNPGLLKSAFATRLTLSQEAIQMFWAPGTTLLTLVVVALAVRWYQAFRSQETIPIEEWCFTALAVYSASANLRSFFHPIGTFHFYYLQSLCVVLAYVVYAVTPRVTESLWGIKMEQGRVAAFASGAVILYALTGLLWSASFLPHFNARLLTRRGTPLFYPDTERNRIWPQIVDYLISNSHPGDSLAVIGHEPGIYFLTDLRNPLRQDTILPGMSASPADAQEIVSRLEADPPDLIVVPRSVVKGQGWFWDLELGHQAYADLAPVWQHIADHYQLRQQVGNEDWGFLIYRR
jgi:hypothetical protein